MKCDCCMREFKKEDLYEYNGGEILICERCREKIRKCPLCGQYYFKFEEMFIGNAPTCYDCYMGD